MKKIKIHFTDFGEGFSITNNFIYRLLSEHYKIIIDEKNPDYLFFSCYSNDHLKFNTQIKIFYTGENIVPDFNLCDYAIGFHHIDFEDRYIRLPLYALRKEFKLLKPKEFYKNNLFDKKFCNFIYSNNQNADPIRLFFFEELCKYKKVDSGGLLKNNLGYNVENKLEFISNYKFTIAFENSAVSGYTTEKIIEPMVANSIPIYWGNPRIKDDFNTDSFVWVKNLDDVSRAIEEIKYLDQNIEAYNRKFMHPWVSNSPFQSWENNALDFFRNIIEINGPREKKYSTYGRSKIYYNNCKILVSCHTENEVCLNKSTTIKSKILNRLKWIYRNMVKHLEGTLTKHQRKQHK